MSDGIAGVKKLGSRIRWVEETGRFYYWNGKVWVPDRTNYVYATVMDACVALAWEAGTRGMKQAQKKYNTKAGFDAVVDLIKKDQKFAATASTFDQDPWILNTRDGILDLRSGLLLPHNAKALCSKMAGPSPDPTMPIPNWLAFIKHATGGADTDTIDWLQMSIGYTLTGITREEVFFFVHGAPGTGKGTLFYVLRELLGDYFVNIPNSALLEQRNSAHPTEVAMMAGARLVETSELPAGQYFNEPRINELTGRDKVSGRFMRKDFFQFDPLCKIWISGNNKPHLKGSQSGLSRRLGLIPFNTKPIVVDMALRDKLLAELPGIMHWATQGCLMWQAMTLRPFPDAVRQYTDDYLDEEASLTNFIADCCELDIDATAERTRLYVTYRVWAERNGEYPKKRSLFLTEMSDLGYKKALHGPGRHQGVRGLRLKSEFDAE